MSTFGRAQNIKVLNAETKMPVANLIILDHQGNYVAVTDDDGKTDKPLSTSADFYLLNHPAIATDTLWLKNVKNNIFEVQPLKEIPIAEVSLKASEKHFLVISGYFSSYITNNGEFSIFVDGIADVIFDRKTNRFRTQNIRQYRSFIMESKNHDRKKVADIVMDAIIKLPNLANIRKLRQDTTAFSRKFDAGVDETLYVSSRSAFAEKDKNLLGYVFSNARQSETFKFAGDRPRPARLMEYHSIFSLDVKHKSEEQFSPIVMISNFYPAETDYLNKNELEKGVRFNRHSSHYSTEYWKNVQQASMYNFLSKKFPEHFKLMENRTQAPN